VALARTLQSCERLLRWVAGPVGPLRSCGRELASWEAGPEGRPPPLADDDDPPGPWALCALSSFAAGEPPALTTVTSGCCRRTPSWALRRTGGMAVCGGLSCSPERIKREASLGEGISTVLALSPLCASADKDADLVSALNRAMMRNKGRACPQAHWHHSTDQQAPP
jgi:hypothetical protein